MKALIFDFGNVIGFFDHQITLGKLAPFTDLSPVEMYQAVYSEHLEVAFESGRMSQAEFLGRARELCRLRCDERVMAAAFADIFQPNLEVCSLIPRLKDKYRLVLGSNTNELHAAKFLEQFKEVLEFFDGLVLSHRIQTRKPDAGFFAHCQQVAGCEGEECLFIDDLPANVAGARTAGLHGLLYRPGNDLAGQLRELGIVV